MTRSYRPEPGTTFPGPGRPPTGLAPIPPPETLQQKIRAQILDYPDTWHHVASDGHWLADQFWPHWAATLKPYGITNDHLANIVAGYRRELWLWIVGERTWEHTVTALAGRLWRRAPTDRSGATRGRTGAP